MKDLPIELICQIMSYLNKNDKVNASLLSKRWRTAYQDASILKNIRIKANDYYISNELAKLNSNLLLARVVNLVFHNSSQLSTYFNYLLSNNLKLMHLKSLEIINNNNLSMRLLTCLLQMTPNLEKLHLIECDSLFFSVSSNLPNDLQPFSNINELSLSKNRHLTNKLFNYLIKKLFDRVAALDLSHASLMNIHEDSNETSQTLFTFNNLLNTLKDMKELTSLNLSSIDLFNNNREYLTKLQATLNLDELILDGINIFNNKSVLKQNLKVLKVTNNAFYDNSLLDIQTKEYLRLQLRKCMINSIGNQLNLTELDLSNSKCNSISFDFPHLNTLILAYCDFISDTDIIQVCKTCSKLKYLDLKSCTKITDTSVNYIVTYLSLIEYLDLSWCRLISDFGFNSNAKRLNYEINSNTHTNFGNCKCSLCLNRFTTIKKEKSEKSAIESVELETFGDVSLNNLKNLKYLKLESTINLTDNCMTTQILGQLYELNVNLCTNLMFNFDIEQNLNLNSLNLSQCHQISETCLMNILKHSINLRELVAQSCPALTNSLIDFMITNRIILHYLDCSFCSNLNEFNVCLYETFLHEKYDLYDFVCEKRFINK